MVKCYEENCIYCKNQHATACQADVIAPNGQRYYCTRWPEHKGNHGTCVDYWHMCCVWDRRGKVLKCEEAHEFTRRKILRRCIR